MNNNLVKILVGVSIALSLGALVFAGVTLYNFNQSVEAFVAESNNESTDMQSMSDEATSQDSEPQKSDQNNMSETNNEEKKETNTEKNTEKKRDLTNTLTIYISAMKDVKGLQPDVIAYLNHEVDQLKDKELPSEEFPSQEDYNNSEKNELIQNNLLEQLTSISSDSKELKRIHKLLLDAEKRIKDYYKYCGESENNITAQLRAIESLNIANIKFREYKDGFKQLCNTNNINFEKQWSLMFPDPKELIISEPVEPQKDNTAVPSDSNNSDSNDVSDSSGTNSSNSDNTTSNDTSNNTSNNANNNTSTSKETLIGRWLGECPDNQHDTDYELEIFDDGTFTKGNNTLTFYGTYTFSSSKRVKFTYEKQTIRTDNYSSTKELNETFTSSINYLTNGKISFDDDYHFGCDHGSYIFTKEK